jgi:hypothetical protein
LVRIHGEPFLVKYAFVLSAFLKRGAGYSSEIYAFQLDAQYRSFVSNGYSI